MEIKKDILWRVYLVYLGLIFFGLMIIGKALYTQRVEGKYWRSMGDSLHTKIIDLDAERGTIFSEDGSMLSTSIPQFDIYMDFGADGLRAKNGERFFKNIDSFAICLSQLFKDKKPQDYVRDLKMAYANKERYYLLHKKVSFEDYKLFRDFPLAKLGRNKSGIITETKTKRLNPYGELGFRTIGLYRENARLVGLERSYDSLLRGTSGKRLVRFVAGGVLMPVEGYEVEPENGYDIYTTLDINIQDIAERALMRKMIEKEALEGTCVVMEVATGKIKAMANLGRDSSGNYFETNNYALRTSEPGSTIKIIPLLTALDEQNKTIQDNIDIHGGKWNIKGRVVSDDHGGAASITLKQAFALSSNVAMSKLAYDYYNTQPEKYYAKLKSLNLTSKTGIELKEEFTPVVPNPKNKKNWNDQTLVSWGFGYALLVSPLQLLMVYNAVANNGKLMKPYLVNEIRSYGTVIQKNNPVVLNSAIASENTINQLRECMEAVCTEGTARIAFQNSLYKVAGKTGTAKVNDGVFKYKDRVYQSSFAGYFPANNPKYSIIVTIKNKPGAAGYYASTVAAPVFKEIADHLFKYIEKPVLSQQLTAKKDSFGYQFSGSRESVRLLANQFGWQGFGKPTGNWQQVVLSKENISQKEITVMSGMVPNVVGMGLKDALYLLESAGYRVNITGKGRVVRQSIDGGTAVAKNKIIELNLN